MGPFHSLDERRQEAEFGIDGYTRLLRHGKTIKPNFISPSARSS
jgi:hypothetical protein